MEQKIRIKYVSNILTQKEKTLPKYTFPEKTNLENLIDLVSEASEEIFSFRIPKDSLYLKVYDKEEFIAINAQNEDNKLIGYIHGLIKNISLISKNLEEAIKIRGEHVTLFKNKKMIHLLNIINPESDSLLEYYEQVQSIIHEIGHAMKEEYMVKEPNSAKKAVEIAKDLTGINELLELCQEIDPNVYTRIIKLDRLDKLMFDVANIYSTFEKVGIYSDSEFIKNYESLVKRKKICLKLKDDNFKRRKDYFEKLEMPYSEDSIQFHEKDKVKIQEEIEQLGKTYESCKKSIEIRQLKLKINESTKKLIKKYNNLEPEIKKDNLLRNEGWAQYFSFMVLDHLLEKTDFFDEHKPEIYEVSKMYLEAVKEDESIYGESLKNFQSMELLFLPSDLAKFSKIYYGSSSEINPRMDAFKKRLKYLLK